MRLDDLATVVEPDTRSATLGADLFLEERFGQLRGESAGIVAELHVYARAIRRRCDLHEDLTSLGGGTGVEGLARVLQQIAEDLDHPSSVDTQLGQAGGDPPLDRDRALLEGGRLDRQGILGDRPQGDPLPVSL
jgi:hypothetical protein